VAFSQSAPETMTKQSLTQITETCAEYEVYERLLSLDGMDILELGCGTADLTRQIATHGNGRRITATEVDCIQHEKNLLIDDLPNVTFVLAGSEAIPSEDETFDIVFMFKSLHHVPLELMEQALNEVHRVLRPGGLAYISEPVFHGDFNDILRLFHDEEAVREAAFNTIKNAADKNLFTLQEEVFFNVPLLFEDFDQFDRLIINVTHNDHQLSPELYQKVKDEFALKMQPDGAKFLMPIRVDLLRKPNQSRNP
jgi:ubiquinone/menaquinone biosynthesis C-methylase UbiE